MASYVAIDFETANRHRYSACAVGVVRVDEGRITESWGSLIAPECDFDPINTLIHGLDAKTCASAPTFSTVFGRIMATMAGCEALVAHSASFDMQVLGSAAMRHEVAMEELTFACTRIFARRWWPGWSSYGLAHVTDRLDLGRLLGGINHHDALWDASAAMIVAERGLQQYGFASWDQAAHEANLYLGVVGGPRYLGCGTRNPGTPIVPRRTQGPFDSENPLYEKTVCFTGALSRFTRRDAAQLAVDAGAFFSAGVTKKTDLLVVGTQDLAVLNGYAYSGKMRRAATMAEQGHHIEIISEDDFYRMIAI